MDCIVLGGEPQDINCTGCVCEECALSANYGIHKDPALSGWATMDAKERLEYEKNLDRYTREELKKEVLFHFYKAVSFERQKEHWRKRDQESGAILYKDECSRGD